MHKRDSWAAVNGQVRGSIGKIIYFFAPNIIFSVGSVAARPDSTVELDLAAM